MCDKHAICCSWISSLKSTTLKGILCNNGKDTTYGGSLACAVCLHVAVAAAAAAAVAAASEKAVPEGTAELASQTCYKNTLLDHVPHSSVRLLLLLLLLFQWRAVYEQIQRYQTRRNTHCSIKRCTHLCICCCCCCFREGCLCRRC